MKKVNRLNLKVDDQLLELIELKGKGKGLSDKVRNLILAGLELQEVHTYKKIEK